MTKEEYFLLTAHVAAVGFIEATGYDVPLPRELMLKYNKFSDKVDALSKHFQDDSLMTQSEKNRAQNVEYDTYLINCIDKLLDKALALDIK